MNLKAILSNTWVVPFVVSMLSMFGLLFALIGDDIWDVLSWIALGIPILIICWSLLKSPAALK